MAKKNKNELVNDKKFNKTLWLIVAAACLVLVAFAVALQINRRAKMPDDDTPVEYDFREPPVRVAEQQTAAMPSIVKGTSLEQAVSRADAILLVRVEDWLGETDTQTLYECRVLETLKGNVGKKLVLAQDGNSRATIEHFPLFTGGNELLVFVTESDIQSSLIPRRQKAYELVGGYATMFYTCVLSKEDGRVCVSNHRGWKDRMPVDVTNVGDLTYYLSTVYEKLAETDPIWENYEPSVRLIYLYDKLSEKIKSML